MVGLFFAVMDAAAWPFILMKSARHMRNDCDGRWILELATSCVSGPVGEDLPCDFNAGAVDGIAEWLQTEGCL